MKLPAYLPTTLDTRRVWVPMTMLANLPSV
jgi:hypothetical protein